MRTVKTDQTGRMPRLIWVFAGCTGYFVGFVMRWFIKENYSNFETLVDINVKIKELTLKSDLKLECMCLWVACWYVIGFQHRHQCEIYIVVCDAQTYLEGEWCISFLADMKLWIRMCWNSRRLILYSTLILRRETARNVLFKYKRIIAM